MEEVRREVYTTRFNKPIFEDDSYIAVTKDGNILQLKAKVGESIDKNIIERFLTNGGANKFAKKFLSGQAKPNKEIIETEEEIEEKTIASKHRIEQLDYVHNQKGFDKWIKRNHLRLFSTEIDSKFNLGINGLITYCFEIRGIPFCCGGKEHGSHAGSINDTDVKYINMHRVKILSKYLSSLMIDLLRDAKEGNNFGIISYIKDPNNLGNPSARIGLLFDETDLFQKVAEFRNPNTGNDLNLYTITNKWQTN